MTLSGPAIGARHHPPPRGLPRPRVAAFIESWFSKLKEREVWRPEYETLEQAREAIGGYVERYYHRPHSTSATGLRRR